MRIEDTLNSQPYGHAVADSALQSATAFFFVRSKGGSEDACNSVAAKPSSGTLGSGSDNARPRRKRAPLRAVMNNFAPSEQTLLSDVVLADFTGSTPIDLVVGAEPEAFNPVTNASQIDLAAPLGGFRWVTGDAVHLPQTIFGYVLLNHGSTVVMASQLLDTPITLTSFPQVIDLGDVNLSLAPNSIT